MPAPSIREMRSPHDDDEEWKEKEEGICPSSTETRS